MRQVNALALLVTLLLLCFADVFASPVTFRRASIPAATKKDPATGRYLREFTLEIGRGILNFDGVEGLEKYTIKINGKNDKTIEVNYKDRVKITVINHGGMETSIHWHGLYQKGTQWNDGAVGGTNCPIPNGANYTYEFNADQTGSYWWHAHHKGQYLDNIRGPFVIHNPNDPNRHLYDEELIMDVSEWFHHNHTYNLNRLKQPNITTAPLTTGVVFNDMGLINDKGQYKCEYTEGTEFKCNSSMPLAEVSVVPGRRYRLRIICTAGIANYAFSIDQHNLTIIEIDGVDIQPLAVDEVDIWPAQRYSVVFTANQQHKYNGLFWIRIPVLFTSPPDDSPNDAILRYTTAPKNITVPSSISQELTVNYTDSMPSPYTVDPAPEPTKRVTLSIKFEKDKDFIGRGWINNSTFNVHANAPTLLELIDGKNVSKLESDRNIYSFEYGDVVELTLLNYQTVATHPFHLHGVHFWIMSAGFAGNDLSLIPTSFNTTNPPKRDITLVQLNGGFGGTSGPGYSVIRFRADNPGVWLIHCHIEFHVELGMSATIVVGADKLKGLKVPQAYRDQCAVAASE